MCARLSLAGEGAERARISTLALGPVLLGASLFGRQVGGVAETTRDGARIAIAFGFEVDARGNYHLEHTNNQELGNEAVYLDNVLYTRQRYGTFLERGADRIDTARGPPLARARIDRQQVGIDPDAHAARRGDLPQRVGQAGEVIAAGDEAQHEAKGHADEDLYAERWAGHAPGDGPRRLGVRGAC